MRALVQDRYGSPDVLRVDDVPTPVPGDNEVLEVAAQNRPNRVQMLLNHDKTTSVNPGLPESRRRGDVELRVTEPTTVADHLADECRALTAMLPANRGDVG